MANMRICWVTGSEHRCSDAGRSTPSGWQQYHRPASQAPDEEGAGAGPGHDAAQDALGNHPRRRVVHPGEGDGHLNSSVDLMAHCKSPDPVACGPAGTHVHVTALQSRPDQGRSYRLADQVRWRSVTSGWLLSGPAHLAVDGQQLGFPRLDAALKARRDLSLHDRCRLLYAFVCC